MWVAVSIWLGITYFCLLYGLNGGYEKEENFLSVLLAEQAVWLSVWQHGKFSESFRSSAEHQYQRSFSLPLEHTLSNLSLFSWVRIHEWDWVWLRIGEEWVSNKEKRWEHTVYVQKVSLWLLCMKKLTNEIVILKFYTYFCSCTC